MEDGRRRKEQFGIDSSRDIWMGSDQLTAFKALRYGISVPYDPMVRGGLLFRGMGGRNALLRSVWFFVLPHQLQAAAFASCQRLISPQPHAKQPEAAASFGEPGCASDDGNWAWGLQPRRPPMSRPPAGRGG